MTPDPLDDLLDRSAPQASSARDDDVVAMIVAARQEAAPRRRTPHVALGVGLAVLLTAGAGVAVAADGFAWLPWAQDPDFAYAYTLPSGRDCEFRIAVKDAIDEDGATHFDADLQAWLSSGHVLSEGDIEAAAAAIPRDPDYMTVLAPTGELDVVARTPAGPSEDDLHAEAVSHALVSAMIEHTSAAGSDAWWATAIQHQCAAVGQ